MLAWGGRDYCSFILYQRWPIPSELSGSRVAWLGSVSMYVKTLGLAGIAFGARDTVGDCLLDHSRLYLSGTLPHTPDVVVGILACQTDFDAFAQRADFLEGASVGTSMSYQIEKARAAF